MDPSRHMSGHIKISCSKSETQTSAHEHRNILHNYCIDDEAQSGRGLDFEFLLLQERVGSLYIRRS